MVNTVATTVPQLDLMSITSSVSHATDVVTLSAPIVFNRHTGGLDAVTLVSSVPYNRHSIIQAVQAFAQVVARGKNQSPFAAAWTFTLDGHEYYVLQLPTQITLILDLATNKWYIWGNDQTDQWRARFGLNWAQANPLSYQYGSDIVVGDNSTGALFFLDPDYPVDDPAYSSSPVAPFERIVYGQTPLRGFDAIPCFGVTISGSLGYVDDVSLTSITLYTSDDQGNTFQNHTSQDMALGQYNQRLYWGSLGSMIAPGRLYKIVDNGGLHRIDGLDMDDPEENTKN